MPYIVLLGAHSDAANKVYRVVYSVSPLRTENIATEGPTFDVAPHLSTGNVDSFEIPETPLVPEKTRCPVYPLVVRVIGKRLHTKRP